MLLVQNSELEKKFLICRFQYIICCWFNVAIFITVCSTLCFNTLYVVGSIYFYNFLFSFLNCFNTLYVVGSKRSRLNRIWLVLFQYIICCWFNKWIETILFVKRVSIHYMLLVQLNPMVFLLYESISFNTLYVVGSMAYLLL